MNTNLEKAVSGQYSFNISAIFGEAWEKTSGFKLRFWKACLTFLVIMFFIMLISVIGDFAITGIPENPKENPPTFIIGTLIQMIFNIFVITPMVAGLYMLAIKNIEGIVLPWRSIFNYFSYWKKLWIYPVVLSLLNIGASLSPSFLAFLISLLLLFLTVTYYMFIPLVVDKNLSTWESLEVSRKTIFHHWFKTLWFLILLGLIIFASLLTLGIALIWTLPWIYNAIGVLYRNMFDS